MSIQPQLLQELDASVKSGFQSLRDSYFKDLIICTVALGVGVVAEELEYILEWRWFVRLIRVFSVRILSPKHRLDSWVRHVSMIGWIVVILGIAGEGLFETLVSRADGWLQDFSNILLASAQRQAYSAQERASTALLEQESLKSENLKLEALIQPRDLTPDQLRSLTNQLKRFAGRAISVRSYALDIEGKRLGMTIEGSLERAGLHVVDNLGSVINLKGKIVEGIEVRIPKPLDDLADAIMSSSVGKDRRFKMVRNPTPGFTGYFGDQVYGENPGAYSGARVEIFVGVKPLPDLR